MQGISWELRIIFVNITLFAKYIAYFVMHEAEEYTAVQGDLIQRIMDGDKSENVG